MIFYFLKQKKAFTTHFLNEGILDVIDESKAIYMVEPGTDTLCISILDY